ncbi:transposase [bacterium]|nr:transposase [bacterium]
MKVAKLSEKIVNQRNNYLHQLTSMLVNENQVICIEDLNVKGML